MADYCKLSQSSFSHMFKDRMGMSPMHYLNYQRIEKAKDFLLSNSMTISNISRLVGFDDPLYFSRVFKNILVHRHKLIIKIWEILIHLTGF